MSSPWQELRAVLANCARRCLTGMRERLRGPHEGVGRTRANPAAEDDFDFDAWWRGKRVGTCLPVAVLVKADGVFRTAVARYRSEGADLAKGRELFVLYSAYCRVEHEVLLNTARLASADGVIRGLEQKIRSRAARDLHRTTL